MTKLLPSAILFSLLVLLTFTTVNCTNTGCCGMFHEKVERTDQLAFPIENLDKINIESAFGSIIVTSGDVPECKISARIVAQAPSLEQAQQLADQTEIKLQAKDGALNVTVNKPPLKNNQRIGVSFNIIVPKQTAIVAKTSYGPIELTNINADITAKTSFSSIKTDNIQGNVNLKTSYGPIDCTDIISDSVTAKTSFSSITCKNVKAPLKLKTSYGNINCSNLTSSDISAKSSFGGINIACSKETLPQIAADIETSYGNIELKTPDNFAGQIQSKTSYGSIDTNLPITVKGKIGKDSLNGTIGQGPGKLNLQTSFGSIKIK